MPTIAISEKLGMWNLNTVILSIGIAGAFVTWGFAWGDVQNALEQHSKRLEALETRMVTAETENRTLANHELRLTNVEKRAGDITNSLSSLEKTLASLATDIKVTREILQRLEQRDNQSMRP